MRIRFTKVLSLEIKIGIGLCLFLITGCKKEVETNPAKKEEGCLITKIDKGGGDFSTYQYEDSLLKSFSENRIVMNDTEVINYTIKRDQQRRMIRLIGAKNNFFIIRDIDYDAAGRWSKTTFSNSLEASQSGNPLATLVPEYNALGKIVQIIESSPSGSFLYTHTYEDSNGDPVKATRFSSTNQYEYYLDKENKAGELDLINLYRYGATTPAGYIPVGVLPAKHLLKKITAFPTGKTLQDYRYEYNQEGYPTTINIQSDPNGNKQTQVVTITYECK